jgi:hypothetical protein
MLVGCGVQPSNAVLGGFAVHAVVSRTTGIVLGCAHPAKTNLRLKQLMYNMTDATQQLLVYSARAWAGCPGSCYSRGSAKMPECYGTINDLVHVHRHPCEAALVAFRHQGLNGSVLMCGSELYVWQCKLTLMAVQRHTSSGCCSLLCLGSSSWHCTFKDCD